MTAYRIILADDHALFRQGVKRIVEEVDELQVVGEAGDGLELLELLKKTSPDLVILDIAMPNMRGLEAAREIKGSHPQIKILLCTMHKKREFVQEAVEAGVEGFLVKESADTELVQAIQAIRSGQKFFCPLISDQLTDLARQPGSPDLLTKREKEIAKLLAEGKSSKKISELLYISTYTVRRHRDNIMKKLNLKGLADLVRYAIEHGYTSGEA